MWYEEIDEKYIRTKTRFVASMKAQLPKRSDSLKDKMASELGMKRICRDSQTIQNDWYQLACGHIKLLTYKDLVQKNTHCYGCEVKKWEKEADEIGLEFVKKIDGEKALCRIKTCGHEVEYHTYDLKRKNKIQCKICEHKRLDDIAQVKGLTYVRKGQKGRTGIYRFHACEHELEIYNMRVKNEELNCPVCEGTFEKRTVPRTNIYARLTNYDERVCVDSIRAYLGKKEVIEKWTREAEDVGLRFLAKDIEKRNYCWYELPCGHCKRMPIKNVRYCKKIENIVCDICMLEKRKKTADEAGLILIELINGDKALYKSKVCGHEKIRYIDDVKKGVQFVCDECVLIKWKKEAEEAGLIFMEKIRGKKATYKCKTCDTVQDLHINAVRSGQFLCKGCR